MQSSQYTVIITPLPNFSPPPQPYKVTTYRQIWSWVWSDHIFFPTAVRRKKISPFSLKDEISFLFPYIYQVKISSRNWLVHQGNILYSITPLFPLPSFQFLSLFTSTDDSQCRTLLITQGVWERTREYLLYLPINHKIKQMRTNLLIIKLPNPNFERGTFLWHSNLECTGYPRGEECNFRSL